MGPVPMAAFEQSAASMLAAQLGKLHGMLINCLFPGNLIAKPRRPAKRATGYVGAGLSFSGSWPGLVDADGGGFGPGAEAFRTDGADVEAEEVADGPVFQAWEISPEASAFAPKFTSET